MRKQARVDVENRDRTEMVADWAPQVGDWAMIGDTMMTGNGTARRGNLSGGLTGGGGEQQRHRPRVDDSGAQVERRGGGEKHLC